MDYLATGWTAVGAPVDVAVMLETAWMTEQLPALVAVVAAAAASTGPQGLAQAI